MGVTWPNFWAARANSSVRREREIQRGQHWVQHSIKAVEERKSQPVSWSYSIPPQVFHPHGKECWPPPNTYRESSVPCGDSKQTTLDGIQLTGQGKRGSMYENLQLPPHRNTVNPKWIFYVFFFFKSHWNADSILSEFTDHIHPCQYRFVERSHNFWGPLTCLPIWLKFL